jgi:hypothetical protein
LPFFMSFLPSFSRRDTRIARRLEYQNEALAFS